ncbi:MAG: RC-LH1 core complex protein PufX [Paracoccaceae bacterium]
MTEKPYYALDEKSQLFVWVARHMLIGAGWAAVVATVLVMTVVVTYWIGLLLPPESRETPSPYGAVAVEQPLAG